METRWRTRWGVSHVGYDWTGGQVALRRHVITTKGALTWS
jgi:hypothetical protein